MDTRRLRQLYLAEYKSGFMDFDTFYHKCCNLEEH